MKFIFYSNKVIEFSFYALFLLIPLIFTSNTSELFEFNKMWLAFGLTIVIGAAWATKMIVQRKIFIQRTPFDIPILLFLASQIIATIFSLDQHVSWWGYYSRFNGGLLSTLTYLFLYVAFVSNFLNKNEEEVPEPGARSAPSMAKRILLVSLISGAIVALWGLPSHFGYDPTCLVFRGSLDVSCWTDAFKPTIRAFSTLGQPAWLAAYMALLLPIAMIFAILKSTKFKNVNLFRASNSGFWIFIGLTVLLYLNLIFANTRAGSWAFIVADILLWSILFFKKLFPKNFLLSCFLIFHFSFFLFSFFFGMPLDQLNKFTYSEIKNHAAHRPVQTKTPAPVDTSITDSGTIRLLVWHGAIDAWKAHPIFGTGVETFAFAYYQYRPKEHNLTSEWDYLYNKAHNEYLNYLATTGAFGLGSYLLLIAAFVLFSLKRIFNPKALKLEHVKLELALLGAYISILISNFFGFSVVIINLYLFLIPALVLALAGKLDGKNALTFSFGKKAKHASLNGYQWSLLAATIAIAIYSLLGLFQFWYADVAYALGSNLDKVGTFEGFQQAYPQLLNAVQAKPDEPVYKDELSINLATLATEFFLQKDASNGAVFAKNAIKLNDDVLAHHANDVVYWKTRVRIFYTLSGADTTNQDVDTKEAVKAITRASELAPTDAKIWYNYGVLVGQAGDRKKAIQILERTIWLKPDYRDAYFALGLFYHQEGMQDKAIETYQYILQHINPNDDQAKKSLEEWGAGTK